MSGCKDFNAISIKMTDVGRAQMAEGLREQKNYCAVKVNGGVGEDFGFAQYITTPKGVIVGYLDNQGKLHADSKKVPYYGVQLGRCDSNMGRKSLRFDRYLTPAKTIKSFYKLFSLKPGAQPQNIFTLDAWSTKRGVLCVNTDRKTATKKLIQHIIDKGCSGMSDKACTALRDDLQSEYIKAHHEEPPQSPWQSFKKYSALVGVSLLGLLGVSIAFGIAVGWLGKWFGPKGGGHGGNPLSGGKAAGGSTGEAPQPKNKIIAPSWAKPPRKRVVWDVNGKKVKSNEASSGEKEAPKKTSPKAVAHARTGISLASSEPVPEGATQPKVPRNAADRRPAHDVPARGRKPGLYDGMAGAAGEPKPSVDEPFSIGVGTPQGFRPEDLRGVSVPDFGEQWAFGGLPKILQVTSNGQAAVIAYRGTASNVPTDYSTEVFVNGEPYYVRSEAGFVANQSFRSSGELMMTAGYIFERDAGESA